jgi:hypothetical protein
VKVIFKKTKKKKTTNQMIVSQKSALISHAKKNQEVAACLELKILAELKLVLLK